MNGPCDYSSLTITQSHVSANDKQAGTAGHCMTTHVICCCWAKPDYTACHLVLEIQPKEPCMDEEGLWHSRRSDLRVQILTLLQPEIWIMILSKVQNPVHLSLVCVEDVGWWMLSRFWELALSNHLRLSSSILLPSTSLGTYLKGLYLLWFHFIKQWAFRRNKPNCLSTESKWPNGVYGLTNANQLEFTGPSWFKVLQNVFLWG